MLHLLKGALIPFAQCIDYFQCYLDVFPKNGLLPVSQDDNVADVLRDISLTKQLLVLLDGVGISFESCLT